MKLLSLGVASALVISTAAFAGPGDLLRVNSDLVNLRAGPTDTATVRDRVKGGSEVIELRSDGGWLGVRVIESGQEGWIYGRLLDRVVTSELATKQPDSGFATLSQDFDRLMSQVNQSFGLPMIKNVSPSDRTLIVTPEPSWLRASSRDAQVLAGAAIYQMWKNHQNNAPVTVILLDADEADYVVIEDIDEAGPSITVKDFASGTDTKG
jgi:uncharacterized protein YgiM (DUF1202 family)